MRDWKAAVILGAAAIAVAVILCLTFFNRAKADDVVNVTGLGTMDFASDRAAWKASFSERDTGLAKAYDKLNASKTKVLLFLNAAGVSASELTMEPVAIQKLYEETHSDEGRLVSQRFSGYQLTQEFALDSADVDKVEKVSREITGLIKQGLAIESESPDYFYAALADLKLKLIALATQDARVRAQAIADNSGASLGKLRYANMGVFQIIGLNSSPEASWEGSFDTKSKMKTATITVRAQFEVK
jgi:uncharacterized protein